MRQLDRRNNFFYLCFALVLLLFSSALARQFAGTWGEDLFSALIVLMLVLSLKSLHTHLAWRKVVWGLAILLALLGLLKPWVQERWMDYLGLAALFLFFAGSLVSAGRQVLFVDAPVDANRIVGSISLYLLLGLLWTLAYLVLLELDPHALQGIEADDWRQAFPQAAYFSFVTLTTLGYGDILPQSLVGRFLAYMEAVAGVFYMAIVVASLVSAGIHELISPHSSQDHRRS